MLFQPRGQIVASATGVGHRDRTLAKKQFHQFLRSVHDAAADLAVTPEYSMPWEVLVDAVRYSGDLQRREDGRGKCADTYAALDNDHIRELLTTLWSEHITVETLDQVFKTVTSEGLDQARWPHAWCEEDLAYERKERLDQVYDHLTELKQEANELAPLVQSDKRDFDM